ncbi:MAG: Na/Pi cotransporter family protein [Firmicutes bacterium]|nr:Na/Pi cotransporter family protein [Bacillota bacterium]
MSITNVLALLGGVALFLFGMSLMSDGLKKVAGSKLELVLYRLSSNSLKGILLGTGVTAVIQSSSATSVMVVGFVNSGMMKVNQAIGIIMGAIIGTSITGWIICLSAFGGGGVFAVFSTDTFTTIVAVAGIILLMFTKKEQNHYIGTIMLGFAVLMYGIGAMSDAVYPLRESETFINMLTTFSNPLLGILIGILFTSVIQSASAAVGILQTLAVTGAIDFKLALPMIMGIAIGAAVPVLLSALGANVNGKRTAFIYLMVDTLGVILFSMVFYSANAILDFEFMNMTMNMMSIALLNTVFRTVIVIILTPCIGIMEKIVVRMIRDQEEDIEELKDVDRLEERFLAHPALAVEQTRITINSMARTTKTNLEEAIALFSYYSQEGARRVDELENVIDTYEDKLGNYIVKIMKKELSDEQNNSVSKYLHVINDFERMSDHAENLAECAQEINEKGIHFTPVAQYEMDRLLAVIKEIVGLTVTAFTEDDIEAAYRIEPLEEIIDNLCDEMKLHHIERIQKGICQYNHGFVFNDMLTNFERIGDHCSNVGIAIKKDVEGDNIEAHGLAERMEIERQHGFDRYYAEYIEKFGIDEKIKA